MMDRSDFPSGSRKLTLWPQWYHSHFGEWQIFNSGRRDGHHPLKLDQCFVAFLFRTGLFCPFYVLYDKKYGSRGSVDAEISVNPSSDTLSYLNLHPREVVSLPQRQVGENYYNL